MTERPILFSGPMVRAILEGRKSQTRRPLKYYAPAVQPCDFDKDEALVEFERIASGPMQGQRYWMPCRYGKPGDRLWVRETFMDLLGTGIEASTGNPARYAYAADTLPGSFGDECRKGYGLKWKPSIFMPRAACRLVLEIAAVGVERVQDISAEDALAEGVNRQMRTEFGAASEESIEAFNLAQAVDTYRLLWDSLNAKTAPWASNPWVWVVEFKRLQEIPA